MIQFNTFEKMDEFFDLEDCDCIKVNIVRRFVSILLLQSSNNGTLGFELDVDPEAMLDYSVENLHCIYVDNPIYQNAMTKLFKKYGWLEDIDLCKAIDEESPSFPRWFVKEIVTFFRDECIFDDFDLNASEYKDSIIQEGDCDELIKIGDNFEYDFLENMHLQVYRNPKIDAALISHPEKKNDLLAKIEELDYFFVGFVHRQTVVHNNQVYIIYVKDALCDSQGYTYDADMEKYLNFNLFEDFNKFNQYLDSLLKEPA